MRTVLSFLGTTLDAPSRGHRRNKWRPTLSIFEHEEQVDRLILLASERWSELTERVARDVGRLSPDTEVVRTPFEVADPWDFEEVYEALLDVVRELDPDPDEDLLVHLTTGTHVSQICLFLLVETGFLPGRLLQTAPPRGGVPQRTIIDLELARYDRIAARFEAAVREGQAVLKGGVATENVPFNQMIDEIERVAVRSDLPILLTGPTGAGKSHLARRIHRLKRQREVVGGELVEVNCATLRGDQAMSALFGHRRGAFTGAVGDREGLLRRADGGLLFLDEIGELGADEQAMLLRAIEEGRFLPVGADAEVESRFQLVCGTNRDLRRDVHEGRFREDLLARIDTWSFRLPPLIERREDIPPNVDLELERWARRSGHRVRFSREARGRYLRFATTEATWPGNFRDLGASVVRLCTLAEGHRITTADVDVEVTRLRRQWAPVQRRDRVASVLGSAADELDRFDRVQLEDVLDVCAHAASMSAAGRILFARSLSRRTSRNDADRLRKYLARHGLAWEAVSRRTEA